MAIGGRVKISLIYPLGGADNQGAVVVGTRFLLAKFTGGEDGKEENSGGFGDDGMAIDRLWFFFFFFRMLGYFRFNDSLRLAP
jgi:hypothetical protein